MPEHKLNLHDLDEAKAEILAKTVQASERMAENPLQLDARTTQIIAAHFSLEQEMELAFERLIARPNELRRLGFGHKVAVLKALIDDPLMDRIAAQLLALNELRNAAAHPRNPDLEPLIRKLHALLKDMEELDDEGFDLEEMLLPDSPEGTSIVSYAAIIAAGLQAVIAMVFMLHSALSIDDAQGELGSVQET